MDINYAIRWLKAHAGKLGLRADAVGLSGQSSGGHLAMLSAMRPADPRYTAVASPDGAAVDASVKAVVMQWPVINPLSRYRNAVRLRDSGNPPAWVGDIPSRHDLYWKTEAAMEEGNPMLILERGEKVALPPALWIQGRPDPTHDYRDPVGTFDGNEPERFAHNYRKAGGALELLYIDNATRGRSGVARPDRRVLPAPPDLISTLLRGIAAGAAPSACLRTLALTGVTSRTRRDAPASAVADAKPSPDQRVRVAIPE